MDDNSELLEAIASGSRLAELKALRQIVAKKLVSEKTPEHAIAALIRQQRELSKDIETLEFKEAEERGDGPVHVPVDESEWNPDDI